MSMRQCYRLARVALVTPCYNEANRLDIGFPGSFLSSDHVHGLIFGSTYDLIDRVNEARIGTMVGVAGSAIVLAIGLWLMSRRAT